LWSASDGLGVLFSCGSCWAKSMMCGREESMMSQGCRDCKTRMLG
jgi:hypothetical protein